MAACILLPDKMTPSAPLCDEGSVVPRSDHRD
jgi:hypothetical protein